MEIFHHPHLHQVVVVMVLAWVYQLRAGHTDLPQLDPLPVPDELQRPRGGVAADPA